MALPSNVLIVTGGDAKFFGFIKECLSSIARFRGRHEFDIGILDLGLTAAQRTELASQDVRIAKADWSFPVPEALRNPRYIGLVARTDIPAYFPGYRTYLWFDADAWAQTDDFFTAYVDAADATGAAVTPENDASYRRTWAERRWWYGNLVLCYGLKAGLSLAAKPPLNIGLFALRNDAPHWPIWRRFYQQAIEKTGKLNVDQHALNAAIYLEALPTAFLPCRMNWIATLSAPRFNDEARLLCEPYHPYTALSVVHLAGPNKERSYRLSLTRGGEEITPITFQTLHPALT